MPARRILILALAALALAGCVRKPAPQPIAQAAPPPAAASAAANPAAANPAAAMASGLPPAADIVEPYTLDSGDKLRVVVFGQDGLSNSYTVDAAGNINMPLIGAVHARGLTPAALSQAIAAQLRNGFI